MTNGHTGEVFSLTTRERAEVTRITADAVKDICPVISSVVCEGIAEAIEHAKMAKEAGARRSTSCRRTTGCALASSPSTASITSMRSATRSVAADRPRLPGVDARFLLLGAAGRARASCRTSRRSRSAPAT